MGLLELEKDPSIVKNYLLDVSQQTYWNMVEMTNLKNFESDSKHDVINMLFKLMFLYSKTPFNYFSNVTNEEKMRIVNETLPDFLLATNSLGELMKREDSEIMKYIDILDNYKVKILVMLESDTIYIPTELHTNDEGYRYPVFLELPIKKLTTLKKDRFFTKLDRVNMYDFNDLTDFEIISCSNKNCFWSDVSLGFLVRMAIEYKQKNKLIEERDFILDIYSNYLIKVESIDHYTEEFLNSVNKEKVNYYITKITYKDKVKFLPLQQLYELISKPFHSVRHPYTKRFLKYLKNNFNNQAFIDILNRDIFNYVNREEDDILYNKLLQELPTLSLVKDIKKDIEIYFIFTTEPEKYINEILKQRPLTLYNESIQRLFKKKIKYIDR